MKPTKGQGEIFIGAAQLTWKLWLSGRGKRIVDGKKRRGTHIPVSFTYEDRTASRTGDEKEILAVTFDLRTVQ